MTVPLAERTVGVLERKHQHMQPGYTLLCQNHETYLLDEDGAVVHQWRSARLVFCAYLLPGGNLLRDGSESYDAPCFSAGGAAGFLEVVDWDNKPVWSFSAVMRLGFEPTWPYPYRLEPYLESPPL